MRKEKENIYDSLQQDIINSGLSEEEKRKCF